jgi:hypothetical protein
MKIYGHCRFSFFGQTDTGRAVGSVEDAQALLWNRERMAVRFHLLENLMLPSIRNQTDQGFEFVIVTSVEMPEAYQDRLDRAIGGMKNARIVRTGERDIGKALKAVMVEASDGREAPAVHFRIDDDDAVCTGYVDRLRAAAAGLRTTTLVTFPTGVLGFTDGDTARHRAFSKHSIAIGLARINAPADTRTPFQIQHRAYAQKNPVYADPTFPAYHYTRHTTNNTNGYDHTVHRSGGVVDIVAANSRKVHPEFAEGAVTTDEAERMIAEAFPFTDGPALRSIIAATLAPEALP